MVSDEVVAVFPSKFKDGDVRLVYCPHNRIYELRYAVQSQGSGGCRLVWSAVAFDACWLMRGRWLIRCCWRGVDYEKQ